MKVEDTLTIINSILASGSLVTVVIVYFTIEALKTTNLISNRFLPIAAMFTGLVVGLLIAWFTSASIVDGATIGVLAGGFASGLYKAIFPNKE